MLGFFIAIISGALMGIQGVFNTGVTKASSVWSASAFVQFSALLVCLFVWALTDRTNLLNVFHVLFISFTINAPSSMKLLK